MRILFIIGAILVLLGIASLFVPIPVREKHGFNAGPVSVGVTTTEHKKVDPIVTGILIAGGVILMVAGRKGVR